MSYNLLLNTNFKDTVNWTLVNCTFDNGILTSTNKVFGIYQELILPKETSLYFSMIYKSFSKLKEVKIGVQENGKLEVNTQIPKLNKQQKISIVETIKNTKIKLHIIFESDYDINRVLIKEPLLVDLVHSNKSTWTKYLLDYTLKYRSGYQYLNEYVNGELTEKLQNIENINVTKAKTGVILKTKENLDIEFNNNFIKNHFYLVKLDYENINDFGKIYFKYGVLKSYNTNNQVYLIFKGNENIKLHLNIDFDDVIEYKTNLKHILISDITNINLLQEDIEYLPFI